MFLLSRPLSIPTLTFLPHVTCPSLLDFKMILVSLTSLKGSNGQPADQGDSHNNIDLIDTGKVVYPKSDMNLSAKDYEEKISWSAITFSL